MDAIDACNTCSLMLQMASMDIRSSIFIYWKLHGTPTVCLCTPELFQITSRDKTVDKGKRNHDLDYNTPRVSIMMFNTCRVDARER